MAASGDHYLVGAQLTARVEQQARQLLAQGQHPVDVVVIQAGQVQAATDLRQAAQQRLDGRHSNVGHAAPQLNHILLRHRAHQFQHLLPLGNFHRPLSGLAHARQGRQLALHRYKVSGLGARRSQAIVLQQPIRLLHRTQAHTMFGA